MAPGLQVLVLMLASALAPACLVPLPLEQQNPTDGGQLLVIKGADPPFGFMKVLTATDTITFSIDIQTDSSALYGRLYLQVDQTCCKLNVSDQRVTRFVRDASDVLPGTPGGPLHMSFGLVVPCYQPAPPVVYLVPVIATGPFAGGPTESLDAQGTVDMNHFWVVGCPD